MKQLTQAMVLLSVLCVLPALTGVASSEPASKTVPVLQAQDVTGGQEDLTPARRYYLKGVELMNNSRFLLRSDGHPLIVARRRSTRQLSRRPELDYSSQDSVRLRRRTLRECLHLAQGRQRFRVMDEGLNG